jgi:hypothetical protein
VLTAKTRLKIEATIVGGFSSAIVVQRGGNYFDAALAGALVGFTYVLARSFIAEVLFKKKD